jgi:hypothetical protein
MRTWKAGLAALTLAAAWGMTAPAAASGQKKQRDVITREEILNSAQKNGDLFNVIRGLRPHFLSAPRGVRNTRGGARGPVVYLNGNKMGETAALKSVLAVDAFEIRYLDPSKAENEFGIGHSGGALVVQLVKGLKSDLRPTP